MLSHQDTEYSNDENNRTHRILGRTATCAVDAICVGVGEHIASMKASGLNFFAYALLPGEFYDLQNIVAVSNRPADVDVPAGDGQYLYYRFCVDEWKHWHYDGFAVANALLKEANQRFVSMHASTGPSMDSVQVAYANGLLDSMLGGLERAKQLGTFEEADPFLVIWMADSDCKIMAESVQRLNQPSVVADFMSEFG